MADSQFFRCWLTCFWLLDWRLPLVKQHERVLMLKCMAQPGGFTDCRVKNSLGPLWTPDKWVPRYLGQPSYPMCCSVHVRHMCCKLGFRNKSSCKGKWGAFHVLPKCLVRTWDLPQAIRINIIQEDSYTARSLLFLCSALSEVTRSAILQGMR